MELSALHYALRYSQYEMIQELLQYGDMKDKVCIIVIKNTIGLTLVIIEGINLCFTC